MKKPELLIPASSLEVLKTAVLFGADAVYIGGEAFGLRAKAKNFSKEEMKQGIEFAHAHGVRVHVTANILAHNYDLAGARNYFEELKQLGPDALIIADPGIARDEITLGRDEYFVMGDNRNNSTDSREPSVGNIHKKDILGRAWLRIWPLYEFELLTDN